MKKNTPFLLAILDGLALNPNKKQNAVSAANTPVLDSLFEQFPWTTLTSFGQRVGLPEGQMGNSEVGHLNIGAGRVIEQDLTRINRTSANDTFDTLPNFISVIEKLKMNEDASLHLIGLCSQGGVHSDLSHLMSIINCSVKLGLKKIRIHCITDGRDRPQKEALKELKILEDHIFSLGKEYPDSSVSIVSLIGRYYAMDRDNRWERTERAYDLFTKGRGARSESISKAIQLSYENGLTDEFIESWHIGNIENPIQGTIEDGDALLFFNFRSDRMRQLVSSFFLDDFDSFKRERKISLSSISTLTEYDETFTCNILFPPIEIKNYLGQVLSDNEYTQLRIAETEKYPHVTYFFNGGNEVILPKEERIMVPSPRDVATYDLRPEMSALTLTSKLIDRLRSSQLDVIILNFANCDMVGHTGNFEATVKAVETVDTCLGMILDEIKVLGGSALITADHGNADQMLDYETGEPHTYHTLHPVPLILFTSESTKYSLKNGGALCDIAPTMLSLLELPLPAEMTGESLLSRR